MNKERKHKLEKIEDRISELLNELETLRDEEQEYYDNMPESFQGGEKGNAAEDAVAAMAFSIADLESAKDYIGDLT